MLSWLDFFREPTLPSAVCRLFVAMVFGGIMGLEREQQRRPAGFRTYMLVSVGSALVMVTNQFIFLMFPDADPSRMGAQVISGIGFLGAGTIIITAHNQVKGLTTAAGLWAVACLGLTAGAGFVEIAIVSFIMLYGTLAGFRKVDKYIAARSKTMELYVLFESAEFMRPFALELEQMGITLSSVNISKDVMMRDGSVSAMITLALKERGDHALVLGRLSHLDGIKTIEELP